MALYPNRREAGWYLARKLDTYAGRPDLVVLALPRGGVPVGFEVARQLDAPLDVVVVRELGGPGRGAYYRSGRPSVAVAGRVVILVDDGLATGATMRAAVEALRVLHPAWLVVAVPVGAPETCHAMTEQVDDVVCAAQPLDMRSVGLWYRDFTPTTDEEVVALLAQARALRAAETSGTLRAP